MAGVGVFGVINKIGVTDNSVAVDSRVGVFVFIPASVGVVVKVNVGVMGVFVEAAVGKFVETGTGVDVGSGRRKSCSSVRLQEESKMAQVRNNPIFFINKSNPFYGRLSLHARGKYNRFRKDQGAANLFPCDINSYQLKSHPGA